MERKKKEITKKEKKEIFWKWDTSPPFLM